MAVPLIQDTPVTKKSAFAILLLCLATATGCSQTMNKIDPEHVHIKRNPHPQQRYELTFTIHDAPGPFDSVEASAAFEISNKECVPTQPISGANPSPNPVIPFEISRVGENTYRGYVYLDLLQDEDYYGLGVCHWKLTSAGPDIKRHNVIFGASLTSADIFEQKSVTTYQWKPYYATPPKTATASSPDSGFIPLNNYLQANDKTKYFSIELSSKRAEL